MLSELDPALCSDSAPVTRLVSALLDAVPGTHVLRNPTRGALATALCEIVLAWQVGIRIEDADVPLRSEVRGACELLGFDPLYVACEGRFVAILRAVHWRSTLRSGALLADRFTYAFFDVQVLGRTQVEEGCRLR